MGHLRENIAVNSLAELITATESKKNPPYNHTVQLSKADLTFVGYSITLSSPSLKV